MSSTAAPVRRRTPTPPPELLTVAEAAEYLNVSPRWIKRAYLDGRLAHVKFGTHVRVPRSDLDRYVAANLREAD